MELLETIKRDPRKKRIIVGILILLIATVAIVAFTFANKSDNGAKTEPPDNDTNSLSVFKTADDEESSKSSSNSLDTVEPIDLSGINGLEYVSKGDGTCYIDGIGSCKDTELKIPAYSPYGDIVIKINDGAFENCTELLSITIPSTVKTVGTGAFRGCSSSCLRRKRHHKRQRRSSSFPLRRQCSHAADFAGCTVQWSAHTHQQSCSWW